MRRTITLLAAAVVVVGLAAVPATARPPAPWSSHGPSGGAVFDIAVDPGHPHTVWAAMGAGGAYRSTDGGTTWSARDTGMGGTITVAIAVAPSNSDVLYAAGCTPSVCKVYRTTDGGLHWMPRSSGLASGGFGSVITAIAVAPNNAAVAYATVESIGVYKTTNGGLSWQQRNSGLTSLYVFSIVVRPAAPKVLFVGDYTGVFVSTNSAGSWSPTTGITSGEAVSTIAIDRTTPSRLYAGTFGNGAWVSSNGGQHWIALDAGGLPDGSVDELVAAPGGHMVYAVDRLHGVWAINGILGGATWTQMNTGIEPPFLADVSQIAVRPSSPGTLYAGTNGGGVFRSTHHAANWARNNIGLRATFVHTLAISPDDPNRVYAGATVDEGAFVSINGGMSWAPHDTGLMFPNVYALAVSRSDPSVVYAATYNGGFGDGIYRSTDSGGTWAQDGLAGKAVFSVAVDPANPDHAWAGQDGIWVTTNGGTTWNPDNNGLPSSLPAIYTIAITPGNPDVMYVGTYQAVFKSTDGGGSWHEMDTGITSTSTVMKLTVSKKTPSNVYAAVDGFGVYRSTDGGSTWSPRNHGLTDKNVESVALDRAHPGTMYAGTSTGVFRSTNSGASWTSFNLGIGIHSIDDIVVGPQGHVVLAATSGGAVFRRNV
jgi:photosystem II stability/assembly factor-like uncharacterized protein